MVAQAMWLVAEFSESKIKLASWGLAELVNKLSPAGRMVAQAMGLWLLSGSWLY
jgi:hypothetical protein